MDDLLDTANYYDLDLEDMSVDDAREFLLALSLELPRSFCSDCGWKINTSEHKEWFMLEDSLWESFRGSPRVLCVGCVEERLERRLTVADFDWDIPLNQEIVSGDFSASKRLLSRMLDKEEENV